MDDNLKDKFDDLLKFGHYEYESKINLFDELYVKRPEFEKNLDNFIKQGNTNSMIMTGKTGSGKTTFLRHYYDKLSKQKEFDYTLFLLGKNISSFEDLESTLLKSIDSKKWRDSVSSDNKKISSTLKEILKDISILIIVDGIDEIDVENQKRVIEGLNRLGNILNKESKYVISMRDTSLFNIKSNLPRESINHLDFIQFSKNEVKEIINKRLEYFASTKNYKKSFYKSLKSIKFEDYPPFLFEIIDKLLARNYPKIEELISAEFEKPQELLAEIIKNIWGNISDTSKHFIRTLLLFENTVSVEKLSLLVDINEEDFLDSINELKSLGIISITGNLLSLTHILIKESLTSFLNQESGISGNTLDIYVDLNYVKSEYVVELLNTLNELYQTIGGEELIIEENEIGVFNINTVTVNA